MIIGIPNETTETEQRVALVPSVAGELVKRGFEVYIETGAGAGADWADDAYRAVGCDIVSNEETVLNRADVVLHVQGIGAAEMSSPKNYRDDQVIVGLLGPYTIDDDTLETLAEHNVSAFALELIPRISRAQSMDALSSMASIGGYKAAVMAAEALPELFPMEMTAAGTVQPADVFVIGAGVAGLKAIATADRLGASVRAYDIRLEVKQEVESLGAEFVELDLETEGSGDDEGYAQEMDEEFYAEQRKQMRRVVPKSDVLITTAAIPGAPAPELVTSEMIEEMAPGSIIVDLAAEGGGNCELTCADETVIHNGVTIFGPTNLPATVSHTASRLYANNLKNFLDQLISDEGDLKVDLEDEIIDSTLLTHDGEIRNPHKREEAEPDGDDEEDADDKTQGVTTDDD